MTDEYKTISFSTKELFDILSSFGFGGHIYNYSSGYNEKNNFQFRYYPDVGLLQLSKYNKSKFIPIVAMPKAGWAVFAFNSLKMNDEWKVYGNIEFNQKSLTLLLARSRQIHQSN